MRKPLRLLAAILIVAVAFGLLWWTRQTTQTPSSTTRKLQVAASFYPVSFFAKEIGGDAVDVHTITPAGTEPHDYDLSARDVAKIQDGDLLLLNGSVESWGEKIRETLQDSTVAVLTAGTGLFTQTNKQSATDPHIWLDPIRAKQEAHAIAEILEKLDAANATVYEQREAILDAKLDQLNSDYTTGLAHCKNKDIVTSHAAFGYLATRYGLHQIAVAGLSPDAEPSPKQLADVVDYSKKNQVSTIFFERLVSPRLSETIAQEIGAKTAVLDPIEGVSERDLNAGKSYFTIMEENLKNLETALTCTL